MQTQQKRELSGPEKLLEFSQNRPLGIKKSVQTSANCLLQAQGKLPYVFVCVILRGINKNWIGPDRINTLYISTK